MERLANWSPAAMIAEIAASVSSDHISSTSTKPETISMPSEMSPTTQQPIDGSPTATQSRTAEEMSMSTVTEQIHSAYAAKQTTLIHLIKETKILVSELYSGMDEAISDVNLMYRFNTSSSRSESSQTLVPTDSISQVGDKESSWITQLHLFQSKNALMSSMIAMDPDSVMISKAIKQQLTASLAHLDRLNTRISDTKSRVLVTGDLNAGKSTFVNAMLRREVVPEDQQPCTSCFVEVLDAEQNGGLEEIHGITDIPSYDRNDSSTFTRLELSQVRDLMDDDAHGYEMLRVYCRDRRERKQSLLHNGVVDISLIDSPGLNIDTMKTSALFAQQEEIDVVVFVVNAENHFTLSGREFLSLAGKEKEFVFVVINKFDLIRRKDRCRQEILDQIRQISYKTWQEASHLVHFVSCRQFIHESPDTITGLNDFLRLEDALRSFILEKRERSKLAPAKIYLSHLLYDITVISRKMIQDIQSELDVLEQEESLNAPVLLQLKQIDTLVLDREEQVIEDLVKTVEAHTRDLMEIYIQNISSYTRNLEWNGPFSMWSYANKARSLLFKLASVRVQRCEIDAKKQFADCVEKVRQQVQSCISMSTLTASPAALSDEACDLLLKPFDSDRLVLYTNDLAQHRATSLLDESRDVFDTSDKIAVAKQFIPGAVVGAIGALGRLMKNWRVPMYLPRPSTVFGGMLAFGIGLLTITYFDLKHYITSKTLSKINSSFTTTSFKEQTIERIVKTTKRSLTQLLTDFNVEYKRQLAVVELRHAKVHLRRNKVVKRQKYFAGVADRCADLAARVDEIKMEESS